MLSLLRIVALGLASYVSIHLYLTLSLHRGQSKKTYSIPFIPLYPRNSRATLHSKYDTSFSQFKNSNINCYGIIEADSHALQTAKLAKRTILYRMPSDEDVQNEARNCETFLKEHGYTGHVTSIDERNFPIAYIVLLYKEVAQFNELLKAIYRPHNTYCIHVDGNSDSSVHKAVHAIANCVPNVFMVSKTEKIVYAGFSRLQADLNCMRDLLAANSTEWRYVINLASQAYPLKTNSEIVKVLRIYNGSNDIEGKRKRKLRLRYTFKHTYKKDANGDLQIVFTNRHHPPPPHKLTVIKGSAYGVYSRAFVTFVLNDKRSLDLLEWCKDIYSPDEYYMATLNHNPSLKAPGGYYGNLKRKPWLASYSLWGKKCAGIYVRGICMYSIGDLPLLVAQHSLFANKFLMQTNPIAVMCMREWLHNKTVSSLPFNSHYYTKLTFIKH